MDELWGWLDYGWRAGDAGRGVWLDVRGPEKATAFWNKGNSPEGERVVPLYIPCLAAWPTQGSSGGGQSPAWNYKMTILGSDL